MSETFDRIIKQPELLGLGNDILRRQQAATRISYAGLPGNCGIEPPESFGPTLGTAVPRAAIEPEEIENS